MLFSFLFLAVLGLTAGKKKNCGLTCYRWEKCMGQLDGSNRPGQLGDTGIIVLNECTPIENGCDCAEFLLQTATKAPTTTTTTSTAAPSVAKGSDPRSAQYGGGLNRLRISNHNIRVPRKQDSELYHQEPSTEASTTQRSSSRGRFSSRNLRINHITEKATESTTTAPIAEAKTTKRTDLFNRSMRSRHSLRRLATIT